MITAQVFRPKKKVNEMNCSNQLDTNKSVNFTKEVIAMVKYYNPVSQCRPDRL